MKSQTMGELMLSLAKRYNLTGEKENEREPDFFKAKEEARQTAPTLMEHAPNHGHSEQLAKLEKDNLALRETVRRLESTCESRNA